MASSEHLLSVSMLKTAHPVGFLGYAGFSDFNYTAPKQGGSEIGHRVVHRDTGIEYLVKSGSSLALFYLVIKSAEQKEKVKMFFGFLVGNYSRITGHPVNPGHVERLSEIMVDFLATTNGQTLFQLIKSGQMITIHDIYQIVDYFLPQITEPSLREVLCLAVLADVTKGALSQAFSNAFQARQLGIDALPEPLIISEQLASGGLFLGSRFIFEAPGLDTFLLAPFIEAKQAQHGDWLAQGAERMQAQLTKNPLKGLSAAILLRQIMGENADIGPDNMIIVNLGGENLVLNIDLTGFRYNRENNFKDCLGWKETLQSSDADILIDRLFHPSVFQSRFIKNNDNFSPEEVNALYECLVRMLKIELKPQVVSEITAVRQWLTTLDAAVIDDYSAALVTQVAEAMSKPIRPSNESVAALVKSNQGFIGRAIQVAIGDEKKIDPHRFFGAGDTPADPTKIQTIKPQ